MTEDTSTEVVQDTSTEAVETETTTEETSEAQEETQETTETPQFYGGQYNSQEEFEKSHKELLGKLNEQGKTISDLKKEPLPADEQQIQDQIKKLGFVTSDQLQQQTAVQTQAQKDNAEIQSLDISDDQATILRSYAGGKDNLAKSMTDCWNELQSVSGGKIVSRKTTIKPKTGAKTGFVVKSAEVVAKLPQADYDKYYVDLANFKAGQ